MNENKQIFAMVPRDQADFLVTQAAKHTIHLRRRVTVSDLIRQGIDLLMQIEAKTSEQLLAEAEQTIAKTEANLQATQGRLNEVKAKLQEVE